MKPHKHAELIKAWADGEPIQFLSKEGNWFDVREPNWDINTQYRIKPTTPWTRLLFINVSIDGKNNRFVPTGYFYSREEADMHATHLRVGCVKVHLSDRFEV